MSRDLTRHPFIDRAPEDAHETIARAARALREGDLAHSESLVERFVDDERFGARALRVLAATRLKGGRAEGALSLFVMARARVDRDLAHTDARALAADLDHRIAHLAHTLDRVALAERAYRACIAHAPSARTIARARHDLGVLLVEEERFEEATRVLHRALAERERVFGLGSRETARTLRELAVVAEEQGGRDRARAYYERALFALGHEDRALRARIMSERSRMLRAREKATTTAPRARRVKELLTERLR